MKGGRGILGNEIVIRIWNDKKNQRNELVSKL